MYRHIKPRVLWAMMALAFLSLQSLFAQAQPSAYDFMRPSENRGLVLSPDGNLVAFTQVNTQKYCLDRYGQMATGDKAKCKDKRKEYRSTYSLIVYDVVRDKIIKNEKMPENLYIGWVKFVSNDRVLMSVGRPRTVGQSGRAYTRGGSRIFSMSLTTAPGEEAYSVMFADDEKMSRQNSHLSNITSILRDEPHHVLMPAYKNLDLDLWKVDVRDGSYELVERGKTRTFFWYTDRAGKPVLRFDCRGARCRKIDVYAPSDTEEKWKRVRTFKLKPDDDESDFDFYPVAPTNVENQFYVLSNEDDDARRSVKIFDIETEEYVKTVYEHPEYDVAGAITDVDTGDYLGAWYYSDTLQYALTDKRHQKHFKALTKYFDNKANVSFIGFNRDGNLAVIHVTKPDSAGAYYVYDYTKRKVTLIVENEPHIDAVLQSDGKILKIPTRDGSEITAYHYFNTQQKGPQAPLLVMPHGGPEARDNFGYDYWAQYFVSRGYQVVTMNFRGSSGYGKAFAEAGYGEWGGLMQDDVTDTVLYFHNKGLATAENTCIVGYSYGGYAALYGGAMTPELYKCIVSGGGLSDLLLSMSNVKKDYGKDSETYNYWFKSKGDPKKDKEILRNKSPVNLADKFTAPVLLIHGEYDGNVKIAQSKVMKKALKKAGKKVEMVVLEGEGHSGWSLENDILYLETIEQFLGEHLTGQITE